MTVLAYFTFIFTIVLGTGIIALTTIYPSIQVITVIGVLLVFYGFYRLWFG